MTAVLEVTDISKRFGGVSGDSGNNVSGLQRRDHTRKMADGCHCPSLMTLRLQELINEAAFCVMEGVATPEAVDAVMKMGMNHPMGPLELADFIGLDVCAGRHAE